MNKATVSESEYCVLVEIFCESAKGSKEEQEALDGLVAWFYDELDLSMPIMQKIRNRIEQDKANK